MDTDAHGLRSESLFVTVLMGVRAGLPRLPGAAGSSVSVVCLRGGSALQKCAMTSISTLAARGRAATWMVERAGKSLVKYWL